MSSSLPATALQMRTTVHANGILELSLEEGPRPRPGEDEVVVRMDAAPLNPSDQGLLFAGADMRNAEATGTLERPVVRVALTPEVLAAMAGRIGQALPAGNEGAGVVVEAGASAAAQALLGKTVAITGGAMYTQYRAIKASQCLVLPAGTTPVQAAGCFVNPLTVLGMVETMRSEGHRALVHTAAASNLGQMLNRLCIKDGIGLVNVVRTPAQAELLRAAGAQHVCDSSAPEFARELTDAIAETGATIAFDAIGGGRLAGQILTAMEAAVLRSTTGFNRYGSNVHKQVYLYGSLDRGPTEFTRDFGQAWGMGGWILTPFLQKAGAGVARAMRERVAAEITTTFASTYTREVSLREALSLEAIADYSRQATGSKYLIVPSRE